MRKFAFALLLVVTMAAAAFAYGPSQDFILINNTGNTIASIYLSPTGTSTWRAEDELADGFLYDGESINMTFDPWENAEYWDIRADFPDGSSGEWYNFDLFRIVEITLESDGTASYKLAQ